MALQLQNISETPSFDLEVTTETVYQQCSSDSLSNCTVSQDQTCFLGEDGFCYLSYEEWVRESNVFHSSMMMPVTVFMALLMAGGTLGNGLVCVVYSLKKKKPPYQVYILSLAVVDFLSSLITHPYLITKLYYYYNPSLASCKMFEFLVRAGIISQVMLFVFVAVDRHYAVHKPFQYMDANKRLWISITFSVALGFTLGLPVPVFYGWKTTPTPPFSEAEHESCAEIHHLYICDFQDGVAGSLSQIILSAVELTCLLICVVAIVVLYGMVAATTLKSRRMVNIDSLSESSLQVCVIGDDRNADILMPSRRNVTRHKTLGAVGQVLGTPDSLLSPQTSNNPNLLQVPGNAVPRRLRSRNRSGNRHNGLSRAGVQATKTVLLVTGILFLSWLPFWIIRIGAIVDPKTWKPHSRFLRMLFRLLGHFIYMNNALNPVLYTFFSRSFRADCKKLWRKLKNDRVNSVPIPNIVV